MGRNEEYINILNILEDTPVKLDYTYDRALLRYRKHKRRRTKRAFWAPLLVLLLTCAVFTVLVNISPAFAAAADALPFIRELVKFASYVRAFLP